MKYQYEPEDGILRVYLPAHNNYTLNGLVGMSIRHDRLSDGLHMQFYRKQVFVEIKINKTLRCEKLAYATQVELGFVVPKTPKEAFNIALYELAAGFGSTNYEFKPFGFGRVSFEKPTPKAIEQIVFGSDEQHDDIFAIDDMILLREIIESNAKLYDANGKYIGKRIILNPKFRR
jgi:hypothetical protein